MSAPQTPPVTIITVPPPQTTTSTTTTTTTTTATEVTKSSVATTTAPSETSTSVAADDPAEGLVVLVFMGVGALAALGIVAARALRQLRARWTEPSVVLPAGVTLADRVREVAARAETEDPVEVDVGNVSVADLYPWLGSPDDLTLVVDLRTAEALQQVGVTSLSQLASIDDETVQSINAAGIDLDTGAVKAAAQNILGRRADGEVS